jgi:hypothetical protein
MTVTVSSRTKALLDERAPSRAQASHRSYDAKVTLRALGRLGLPARPIDPSKRNPSQVRWDD